MISYNKQLTARRTIQFLRAELYSTLAENLLWLDHRSIYQGEWQRASIPLRPHCGSGQLEFDHSLGREALYGHVETGCVVVYRMTSIDGLV